MSLLWRLSGSAGPDKQAYTLISGSATRWMTRHRHPYRGRIFLRFARKFEYIYECPVIVSDG